MKSRITSASSIPRISGLSGEQGIPQRVDELLAQTPLPTVVGRSVRLAKSGRQWKGCCPFHGEKTPNFYVYGDHYHCFGCGVHGNAIDFLVAVESITYGAAAESLAAEVGLQMPALPGAKGKPPTEAGFESSKRRNCGLGHNPRGMPCSRRCKIITPMAIWRMLLRSAVCFASALLQASAGNNNAARIAIMAMTTSSSIRVNPARRVGDGPSGFELCVL